MALRVPKSSLLLWQILLCLFSGALLALAFSPLELAELAFIVPVGFFLSVAHAHSKRAALILGAVFGLSFALLGLAWMLKVGIGAWLAVSLLVAFYFALTAIFLHILLIKGVPLIIAGPSMWILFELARTYLFLGFPWLLLGHALSPRLPLIQIAEFGGVYIVSWVCLIFSAGLTELIILRPNNKLGLTLLVPHRPATGIIIALAILTLSLIYGSFCMSFTQLNEGAPLLMVQGNIDTPKMSDSPEAYDAGTEEIWQTLSGLSSTAPKPKEKYLLVWSEAMLTCYYNNPSDANRPMWNTRLNKLLRDLNTELLIGGSAHGQNPALSSPSEAPHSVDFNTAYLLAKDASIKMRYDKIHLVPLGEYVPLRELPILKSLTPYTDQEGYEPGHLAQPLVHWNDTPLGILICFEDIFPALSRRAKNLDAEMLLVLSSEAWFAPSSELLQHFQIARFRAVETRLPLLRCCNVGVTCSIDPLGNLVNFLGNSLDQKGVSGCLAVKPLLLQNKRKTFYSITHELLPLLLALMLPAVMLFSRKWRGEIRA